MILQVASRWSLVEKDRTKCGVITLSLIHLVSTLSRIRQTRDEVCGDEVWGDEVLGRSVGTKCWDEV